MRNKIIAVSFILFCLAFIMPCKGVSASVVTDEVKKTVDEVVQIVSDKELKQPRNEQKRRAALKQAVGRIFDYGEMSRRSLGANWKKLTAEQRKEFAGLFATLLENTYAGKIESYNNEKILYGKEQIDGSYAEVDTKVVTAKHDEYTLNYRLLKEGNKWMVYDVVIEGVSLISNYRTQFNKIMNEQGYKELVKKLKTKNEGVAAP